MTNGEEVLDCFARKRSRNDGGGGRWIASSTQWTRNDDDGEHASRRNDDQGVKWLVMTYGKVDGGCAMTIAEVWMVDFRL